MDLLNNVVIDITKSFQEMALRLSENPSDPRSNSTGTGTSTSTSTSTNTGFSADNRMGAMPIEEFVCPSSSAAAAANDNGNDNGNGLSDLADEISRSVGSLDKNHVNILAARELTEMSPSERVKVFDELHGVAETKLETAEENARALHSLSQELQKMTKKPAYDVACLQNVKFVNDQAFQLMFLRAEEMDPKRAAQRIIRYFEEKRTLFGDAKLTKFITLSDLDHDDLECLVKGSMQILSSPDRSGRLVLLLTPQHRVYKTLDNLARAYWYTYMVGLRSMNAKAQQMGTVTVGYDATGVERHTPVQLQLALLLHRITMAVPMRISTLHFCIKEEYLIVTVVRLVTGKSGRGRSRIHFGSPMEIRHELLTYGVIDESLPIDDCGTVLTCAHLKWLQQQQIKEGLSTSPSTLCHQQQQQHITITSEKTLHNNFCVLDKLTKPVLPLMDNDQDRSKQDKIATMNISDDDDCSDGSLRPFDVPFGRGAGRRKHSGYQYFRQLVDKYSEQYQVAGTKFDKTALSELIMKLIHEKGGRFVIQKDSEWIVAEHIVARKKVAQCIRFSLRTTG